jgi:hypothetical protein
MRSNEVQHACARTQAYLFDTLPIDLQEDELCPGDLIFIQGTYYDSRKRKVMS